MDTAAYRFPSVIILCFITLSCYECIPIDVASFSFTYFLVLLLHFVWIKTYIYIIIYFGVGPWSFPRPSRSRAVISNSIPGVARRTSICTAKRCATAPSVSPSPEHNTLDALLLVPVVTCTSYGQPCTRRLR